MQTQNFYILQQYGTKEEQKTSTNKSKEYSTS